MTAHLGTNGDCAVEVTHGKELAVIGPAATEALGRHLRSRYTLLLRGPKTCSNRTLRYCTSDIYIQWKNGLQKTPRPDLRHDRLNYHYTIEDHTQK